MGTLPASVGHELQRGSLGNAMAVPVLEELGAEPLRKAGGRCLLGGCLGCAWEGCALPPCWAGRWAPSCLLSRSGCSEQPWGVGFPAVWGPGRWGVPIAAVLGRGGLCSLLPLRCHRHLPGWAAARPGHRRWRSPVPGWGLQLVLPQGHRHWRGPVYRCCSVNNGAAETLIIRELFHLAGAGTTRSSSWKLKLA